MYKVSTLYSFLFSPQSTGPNGPKSSPVRGKEMDTVLLEIEYLDMVNRFKSEMVGQVNVDKQVSFIKHVL